MVSALKTPDDLITFFQREFPDAISLIGREHLIYSYFHNPKSRLMSIKCTPYHYKNKALIIGDAAHNQVPFYGQGLNAGFEDLTVLFSLFPSLSTENLDLESIFSQYTHIRTPDVHAICDLALHNYWEMASGVVSPGYILRKWIEDLLYRYAPWTGIIPLYTMVSFGGMRYSEVRKKWRRQGRLLRWGSLLAVLGLFLASKYRGKRLLKR